MITSITFPGKYVQGCGAVNLLGPEILKMGGTGFVITSPTVFGKILPGVREAIGKSVNLTVEQFRGECCEPEIDRLVKLARQAGCGVIIGLGGGKTLDTAKVVASELGARLIILPTIASSDAPCTALAVIYTPEGEFNRLMPLPRNPDVVLVDTEILLQVPVRFLVAGMGDALSSLFDGEPCYKKGVANLSGQAPSLTAYEMCRLTYEILMEHGLKAREAAEARRVTPEVEYVIESNTLLSGLCHENAGAAAPHAIGSAFTVLEEAHAALHGEEVALGTLASLFLTGKSEAEIDRMYSFYRSIGLPVTLADIGLNKASDGDILKVAEAACQQDGAVYNELVPVSIEAVAAAIKAADDEGRRRKTGDG